MTEDYVWVDHDGLRFRCRVEGPGAGAPWVVFANSLVTDLNVWRLQAEALHETHNVLRYDQRGHGGTSPQATPCTFDQLGGDAAMLLDRLGIARCTFVGLSMGVPTALHLYANHPERIERLVLSDGQSATAPSGAGTWQSRIDEARAHGMPHIATTTMERWFAPAFRAAGKAELLRESAAAMTLEGYVSCAQALQGYDFRHVLETISVPTLLMAGANDGNMPNSMRTMRDAIPGAQLEVIADAGHIPNWEQPDAFNQYLLGILKST